MDIKQVINFFVPFFIAVTFLVVGFLGLLYPDKIADFIYKSNQEAWKNNRFSQKTIQKWVYKPNIWFIRFWSLCAVTGGSLGIYAMIRELFK